jgi:predicted CopG family antitoxin
MLRKTITLSDDIYNTLETEHIVDNYSSFSELVSVALETLIKEKRKEAYRQSMIEASKDEKYLEDIRQIQEDFKYVDCEIID